MKLASIAAAVATSVLLAACGGSSDGTVDATGKSAAQLTATAKAGTNGSIFYGMNGHVSGGGAYDASSPQQQLSQLQDLGAKIYRSDVYNQASAARLGDVAQIMANGGVTVYPVMMMGLGFDNEDEAYNAGFALAQQTANAYHYQYYEVGNELESFTLNGNVDGTNWQNYNNHSYQIARGVIRGMIAGVRSVDSNGKIVVSGTWLHTSFFQMLADGSQPDGTWGHPTVSWDITAWHWYSNEGNITEACGGTGCYNVLAMLNQMGHPIWINEFGVRPNLGSVSQIASYLTGSWMMAQYYGLASQYNIQSIQGYELYDDSEGAYGLMQADGRTQKPAYWAYKSFVQNRPR